jgi:PAS domain S-box-containing protein
VTIDSDSAKFSRVLRAAILWPVSIIFITAVFLLLLTFVLFQFLRWSDHSYQVLQQTRLCENHFPTLQNLARGYLLSGDASFLSSFDQDDKKMEDDFVQLRKLVQDNAPQFVRINEIIQAKAGWLEHMRIAIDERSKGTMPDSNWIMNGKVLTDGLTSKLDDFAAVEEKLQHHRLERVRFMEKLLIYAGGALAILLAAMVGQLVRQHFMQLAGEYRSALTTIQERHAALVRSEADLEEQKEWFRVTLSSIGDGVIVTDEEGRVVFMNQEAERLTGNKGLESVHKPLPDIFKIVNEDTRREVENPVAKVFREKKVIGLSNHTILISSDGKEWPIEDSAAPIYDAKGKTQGVVLVFHDASEMRRAQNTLKAYAQDLEKKVAERTESLQQTVNELEAFSYTVSHDLRSPLRAMQGFSQALLEDFTDKLDKQGTHYLNRIAIAAERLDRLIQDLLAYSRISRKESELISLDLDKAVREIIEHYPNLHYPAVQIEVIGKLPLVMGREAALTQVISNLLGNAAKFVAPGTLPEIKVWAEESEEKVKLWVQDNGIGIASRDFDRIFLMFTQANEPALYAGTGVGLAIVKKAAQTMHGSVGVESELGKGSKFWVEFKKAKNT